MNCAMFVCRADKTNVLRIIQNGVPCLSVERLGQTNHETCAGLSIEAVTIENDTHPHLSAFVVEGKQCFEGKTTVTDIQCVDAQHNSQILKIGMFLMMYFLPLSLSLIIHR